MRGAGKLVRMVVALMDQHAFVSGSGEGFLTRCGVPSARLIFEYFQDRGQRSRTSVDRVRQVSQPRARPDQERLAAGRTAEQFDLRAREVRWQIAWGADHGQTLETSCHRIDDCRSTRDVEVDALVYPRGKLAPIDDRGDRLQQRRDPWQWPGTPAQALRPGFQAGGQPDTGQVARIAIIEHARLGDPIL